jgi:iron(III) transport system permease protein
MAAIASATTSGVEAVRVRPAHAHPPAALIAATLVGVTLVLLPILYTVVEAASVDFRDAVGLLFRPLVGSLLFNTVSLVIAASLASAVIGTAAAWVVERTNLPGRKVWSALLAAPLAIPPFVTSYAWVSMSNALQDFAGALLVVTCAYYPLVYLPVAAALRGLDPALEETGRSLGESAWGCFLRVVLPQLRPALLGGALLVALDTLTEFGAFALLRFRTFTTELYAQYRTGLAGPETSLLALVLVALCLALLLAEFRVRGDARYARVGAGTRRSLGPAPLGWARAPVLGALAALVAATLGVPIGMIVYWLFQHAQAATSPVAPAAPALVRAALNSVGYGLFGAGAALLFASPIGYLAVRFPSHWTVLMERAAYLAQGVPGIVVALALISLTVQWVGPLYQSPALLVLAYAILFLPLALVSVRATLSQIPPGLEEAGRSLGQNNTSVAWRVIAPLAANGLGAGAALVFIFVSTELTATLLLSPIGTRTLATEVWANTSSVAFAAAAPFAALMLCLSFFVTWLFANRLSRAAFAGWS